jgi:hypothetical protein
METLQPVRRRCSDCANPFEITVAEQVFLQDLAARKDLAFHLPNRCTECRRVRRRLQYAPAVDDTPTTELLTCVECGASFIFGGRDRAYFASRGWATPKRCRECRHARQAQRERTA